MKRSNSVPSSMRVHWWHCGTVPGSSGAPGVLQDEEVHSQLHQIPLHCFSRHAAVHGVDQFGSLPARNTAPQRNNAQNGKQLQSHFIQ